MLHKFIPPEWCTPALHRASRSVDPALLAESVLRPDQVFAPLSYFPPEDCRVVVLGQDPYAEKGKGTGLAFALSAEWVAHNPGEVMRSSFGGIARELAATGCEGTLDYSLTSWAEQGVLLLNTSLSVRESAPNSHKGAWGGVVSAILDQLPDRCAWLVWGSEAKRLALREARSTHSLIISSHPAGLSANSGAAPFAGSGCFRRANEEVIASGHTPIEWVNR